MIGNCRTAALISRYGSIDWACMPRFDSPALFCRLLDVEKGAFLQVSPSAKTEATRCYLEDTLILVTRFRTQGGELLLTDFMPAKPFDAGHSDLENARILRLLEVSSGRVEVSVRFRPGFNYVRDPAEVLPNDFGCTARTDQESVAIKGTGQLCENVTGIFEGRFEMAKGDRRWITLCFENGKQPCDVSTAEAEDALASTQKFWCDWMDKCSYRGPYEADVRRSAVILKALIYQPTGALIAAPTAGLPERMGGNLNWDFRYSWLRDSGLVVDVLQQLGYHDESIAFLDWLNLLHLDHGEHLQPVYRVDGSPDLPEEELPHLRGYRGSQPVRIGNAAAKGFQLDAFGYVAEAAAVCYLRMPRPMDSELWDLLTYLLDAAQRRWREPDRGIWEDRGEPRHYLHSKLYCWLAFDSMLRLADHFDLPGDTDSWRETRNEIHQTILEEGYDPEAESFRQILNEPGVDATVLLTGLVGFLPSNDPRVQSSIEKVRAELSIDGLITRRRSPDLQKPDEGAFLLCNFWLIDVLLESGRQAEAKARFHRVLSHCNDVGLLPEEVDPKNGDWLGAFPIGYSHLALVRTAIRFAEAEKEQDPAPPNGR